MGQQTAKASNGGVHSGETISGQNNSRSKSLSGAGRKLFNCCVGRLGETLREAGGTLVFVGEPSGTVFDVVVDAEFPETPRVVDSKSLGQYDVDELGFHGIRPREDGGSVTTFSAEYGGVLYGLRIIVPGEGESEGDRDQGREQEQGQGRGGHR